MSTKFFIGGNKFYDSKEEADAELTQFQVKHNIPAETFVVVKINKQDEIKGDEFKPKATETVH